MDPLTIATSVIALIGVCAAWRLYHRARRAETEAASLRAALVGQRWSYAALPNQRPWRVNPAGSRPGPKPP